MAEDDDLINEMIQQARANGEEDGNPLLFNVGTFAEALTKDVTLYNITNEANASTLTQDVFQEDITNGYHNELTHIRTAPEIDIQAGTYRSKGASAKVVFVWTTTASSRQPPVVGKVDTF